MHGNIGCENGLVCSGMMDVFLPVALRKPFSIVYDHYSAHRNDKKLILKWGG